MSANAKLLHACLLTSEFNRTQMCLTCWACRFSWHGLVLLLLVLCLRNFVSLIHFQTSTDGIYLSRHIGLKLGIPVAVPALTVNRLCGSGFQAIINGAQVTGDLYLLRRQTVCVSIELFSICFSFVTALGLRRFADILNVYVPFRQFCSSFDVCLFRALSGVA